ncbi:MAG TPA: hypothetical protein VMV44_10595 [Rectinemataceae bacterium]|nr:hypothetical protein [Rectinemataceae bacterium]
MNETITIIMRDEAHLRAHLGDFAVPLEEALGWARQRLQASKRREGWEHFDFEAPKRAGLGGLRTLRPWTRGDFWARRRGRSLPSHLIVGKKSPTRRLCVWGFWRSDKVFVLHTLYPGRRAPREIHDPELPLAELPAALRFWTRHAIVVAPSEWES